MYTIRVFAFPFGMYTFFIWLLGEKSMGRYQVCTYSLSLESWQMLIFMCLCSVRLCLDCCVCPSCPRHALSSSYRCLYSVVLSFGCRFCGVCMRLCLESGHVYIYLCVCVAVSVRPVFGVSIRSIGWCVSLNMWRFVWACVWLTLCVCVCVCPLGCLVFGASLFFNSNICMDMKLLYLFIQNSGNVEQHS